MLPTNTPSNVDSSNSFNTKHTVSTSDNSLAIFKSPCDTSDILISVSGNKKVYVYNKLPNGWAYVEYHGVKGYMIVAELIFL